MEVITLITVLLLLRFSHSTLQLGGGKGQTDSMFYNSSNINNHEENIKINRRNLTSDNVFDSLL